MATASSAQREPSMEEILASIRRIIEDNDTGRTPADLDSARNDNGQAGPAAGPIDIFGSDAREPSFSKSSPATARARDSFAAGLEAESGVAPIRTGFAGERQPADPAGIAVDGLESASSAMPRRPAGVVVDAYEVPWPSVPAPVVSIDRDLPYQAGDGEYSSRYAETEPADIGSAAERAPDAVVEAAGEQEVPAASADDAEAAATSVILSQHAERKVAAAFGELSEAMSARGRKSFDEIAQEMMRPMLQDWLDNNLPTLVERLVREEIERVARGPK